MIVIYTYILDLILKLYSDKRISILDYGCGAGEIVQLLNSYGYNVHGVDPFLFEESHLKPAKETGLFDKLILELKNGIIPFKDNSFDLVISNQVFEHIDDFTQPLQEIVRVLKPHGKFINIFPALDIWRDGHFGIPFIYKFRKGSRLRFYYTLVLRRLRFGKNKINKSITEWTDDSINILDKWSYYKSLKEINQIFSFNFTIDNLDAEHLLYRIAQNPILSFFTPVLKLLIFRPILRYLCNRLIGHVFLLQKK